MYVENVNNYFHDFRRLAKCAMIKFKIVIENSWSLKLHQTNLCVVLVSSTTQSAPNGRLVSQYPAHLWVPRRNIRAEVEGRGMGRGEWGGWRGKKGWMLQGEQKPALPPLLLTPPPHPLAYNSRGPCNLIEHHTPTCILDPA